MFIKKFFLMSFILNFFQKKYQKIIIFLDKFYEEDNIGKKWYKMVKRW